MRSVMLTVCLCLAVVTGACDTQNSVTEPTTQPSAMEKLLVRADFTIEQISVVDEMFYAGEDLHLILPAAQADAFDAVTGPGTGMFGDPSTKDARIGVDMDVIVYLQLIIKANPTMDPAKIAEIKRLIAENYRLRLAAIKGATDRTALQAELQKLHDQLMRQINAQLTPGELANVEALKARIEKDRQDIRTKLDAARVDAQVRTMVKVLGLSERQAAAVRDLLLQQLREMAALRAQYKNDPEGLRAALARLQTKYNTVLQQTLGDELWAKWLRYLASGVKTGGDTGGGKTGGDTGGGKTGGGKTGGDSGGGKTGGGTGGKTGG